MEVAPFFVGFHHFWSIFTIFYRVSRFTHFCHDLHFGAIYALFPQFFFGQNSLLRNITRFLYVWVLVTSTSEYARFPSQFLSAKANISSISSSSTGTCNTKSLRWKVINYNESYRQVLHDVDKVLLGQGVLIQLVLLGLEVLWVRFGATKHLDKHFSTNVQLHQHYIASLQIEQLHLCK